MSTNAYAHMAYKLHNPSRRISLLGVMSLEEVTKRFMHNMYPHSDIEAALHQCAREGTMQCVWLIEGRSFVEEDFNLFTTLKKIQNGDIFNEDTGQKYDTSQVGVRWAVSQSVLNKIQDGSGMTTLLDRMLKWLRFWERN